MEKQFVFDKHSNQKLRPCNIYLFQDCNCCFFML